MAITTLSHSPAPAMERARSGHVIARIHCRPADAFGLYSRRQLVTAIQLMQMLGRPLLLEGEAGVGKTAVARLSPKCMIRS